MSFNLASGQSSALLIRSHPLGIGEGFEQLKEGMTVTRDGLNPLGIGEGFELTICVKKKSNQPS
ncbi:hypothetical protein MOTT16_02395 [Moraxella osloensis]|uniref:Uncharacterized protein n=1 Tax=Faucicola osloensis TaxID=34062 RepID=A0AAD0EXY2_FAUOS|nr:hypothetical protein YHS_02400 [Moraxella osloensis]ATW85274.1 hypothetical protein MOTT16_02395 [Moraxella osloensis]